MDASSEVRRVEDVKEQPDTDLPPPDEEALARFSRDKQGQLRGIRASSLRYSGQAFTVNLVETLLHESTSVNLIVPALMSPLLSCVLMSSLPPV